MKALLGGAFAAAAMIASSLVTAAPASAYTYPTQWSTPVLADIPANCAIALPSISLGNIVFLGSTDFIDHDTMNSVGYCNFAFKATWTSKNGKFTGPDSSGHLQGGKLLADDGVHTLLYSFEPPFAGGNANQLVGGSYDVDISGTDDGTGAKPNVVGNQKYQDVITLTVSST